MPRTRKSTRSTSAPTKPAAGVRLTWDKIVDFYSGEWVELVDYEWEWNKPYPTRARVRQHSTDRTTLLEAIRGEGLLIVSTIMFVGQITPEHAKLAPAVDTTSDGWDPDFDAAA